jgi:hypothetical protein
MWTNENDSFRDQKNTRAVKQKLFHSPRRLSLDVSVDVTEAGWPIQETVG